jgi:salicylate 5-hydroxylase large subunit
MNDIARRWPGTGVTEIPYWVYTDKDVYESELDRIWYGEHWLYAGLEAEVPQVGSYRTTSLGERQVIVVRSAQEQISVLENRCRHRGVQICQDRSGKLNGITCPYHQWSYALDGALQGVPFRRGIKGKGGMSRDFSPADYGLLRLKVEVVNGVIWASFSDNTPPFREYLGARLWRSYERIVSGRRLRVVGYNRQLIPANWKLVIENIRDPYHGALLHVFLPTFGLFRPDQASELRMDETGRHGSLMSLPARDPSSAGHGEDITRDLAVDASLQLADKRLIETVKELEGNETLGSCCVFPSVIFLQQINALQIRHIIPKGADACELVWTHFGFVEDDEDMRQRRIRHGNLFGPGGLVSVDDSEVLAMAQRGFKMAEETGTAIVRMGTGGRENTEEGHMATESAIRGLYQYYREVMGL